jgi:polar amino acid transport system substrate-binding protein
MQRKSTLITGMLLGVASVLLVMVFAGGPSSVSGQAGGPKSLLKEIHDKGELRVGLALAEPHQFKDPGSGEWKGIAVDIMKDWAKILNVKFVAVDTSWDTMIPGLEAGKYDVASALNRRPPRALVVTFSIPYTNDLGVFAVDRRKSQAHTWADINKSSQTVCVVLSTAEDSAIQFVGTSAKILRLPDENECRLALQSGRATAFFDDVNGHAQYAAKNDWVRLIVPTPTIELQGIAFALRKGYAYDDVQALDIQIEHWTNEGLLAASQRSYNVVAWQDFTRR